MTSTRLPSSLIGMLLALALGCSASVEAPTTQHSTYAPTEGWAVSTPEEQGMDSEKLAAMLRTIAEKGFRIDAVFVARNGREVLNASNFPYRMDRRHKIYSCTKSVLSALIGIAIERGYLTGVDQPVVGIFSDYEFDHLDAHKRGMTIEDLLTMSTCLDCRDSYKYRWAGLDEMWGSDDWIQYVLDLPMVAEPGTRFEYCNGASFLLSAILQETAGRTAFEFAGEHLFGPLGIIDVEWSESPQGYNLGYAGLTMLPEDMAKFGQLYLNEGAWGDKQLIPAEWVAASTRPVVHAQTLQPDYGYQWWIAPYGAYLALGYQGQYIAVLPELDLVAVFVSELPDEQFFAPNDLIEQFVIPAAVSRKPLRENPGGTAMLQAQIERLAGPP